MKWLVNTIAALAELTESDTFQPTLIQPRGLKQCTGSLGPNQLAWCDANLQHFKQCRLQAEAAWSEPRLPLVDSNVLMRDYGNVEDDGKTLGDILRVITQNVPATNCRT